MTGFASELNVAFGTVTEGSGGVSMVAIIVVGIICLIGGFILGLKLHDKLGFGGGKGQPKMTSQDVFRQAQGMAPMNNQQPQQRRPQQRPMNNQGYPQQNMGRPQQRPMQNNGGMQRRPGNPQQRPQGGYPQQNGNMQRRPQQRPMQQPQQNMNFENQMQGRGWDDDIDQFGNNDF